MSGANRSRYERSQTRPRNAVPGSQAKTRRCLKCRGEFLSQDWGTRICDGCRSANARVAPAAEDVTSCGGRVRPRGAEY